MLVFEKSFGWVERMRYKVILFGMVKGRLVNFEEGEDMVCLEMYKWVNEFRK